MKAETVYALGRSKFSDPGRYHPTPTCWLWERGPQATGKAAVRQVFSIDRESAERLGFRSCPYCYDGESATLGAYGREE